MALWVCRGCTAAYAPGAPRCPQCGVDDPIEEAEQLEKEQEMAKITVHGGPTNDDAEEPAGPADGVETTAVEVEEGHEAPADGGQDSDESAEVVDYNAFTVEELRAELAGRDLPVSGNKPELVKRLADDDEARADEAEQENAE